MCDQLVASVVKYQRSGILGIRISAELTKEVTKAAPEDISLYSILLFHPVHVPVLQK